MSQRPTGILVVGNYCHDTLRSKKGTHRVLGGSAAYISAVLRSLQVDFRVVAKVGEDFLYAGQVAAAPLVARGAKTTSFLDDYTQGERIGTVESFCAPLLPADLEALAGSARVAIACAVAGEISLETMRALRGCAPVVLCDAQGLIRTFGPHGEVGHRALAETKLGPALGLIDHLKVSRSEAPYVDLAAARARGTVLLTDGANGCDVLQGARATHLPAFPAEERDATGAGDCFLAGYAVGLLRGLDAVSAARVGTFCGARAVEAIGVPRIEPGSLTLLLERR